MIVRLERQQVALLRPTSHHHRSLARLTRRHVSVPANGPQGVTRLSPAAATSVDDFVREPASSQPRSPETEVDRKSGAGRAMRQPSASERSAHARTDVSGDVSIASSVLQNGAAFNKVC